MRVCKNNYSGNDVEYREKIIKRLKWNRLLCLLGFFTAGSGFFAEFVLHLPVNEKVLGFYTGAGSGIAILMVVFCFIQERLLRNPEKLKENRLKETDERVEEINKKAFDVAATIVLVGLYIAGIIFGLIYEQVLWALYIVYAILGISYFIARAYLNRTM